MAAELLGDRQPAPADVVERLPRGLEALGRLDLAIDQRAAGGVAGRVQRAELILRPVVDLAEHRLDLLLAPVLVRGLAEDVLELELLEQHEADVAQVGLVAVDGLGHGEPPGGSGTIRPGTPVRE
jgi:hypothetical protein